MSSLQSPLPCILAALRFLTVLPVRHGAADDGRCFAGSLFYFPLIGLGIGLLTALAATLLGCILPQAVVALVAIVMLAGISGFLHIDGLADTADGLLSSRPREQKLEIMRDSRTGAMGVTAIVWSCSEICRAGLDRCGSCTGGIGAHAAGRSLRPGLCDGDASLCPAGRGTGGLVLFAEHPDGGRGTRPHAAGGPVFLRDSFHGVARRRWGPFRLPWPAQPALFRLVQKESRRGDRRHPWRRMRVERADRRDCRDYSVS